MKNKNILPEVVNFKITSRCNNDCKYCFGPEKTLKEMDFSKLKKLFQLLYKNGVKGVNLTGGEPLLYKDFREVIYKLKEYHFKIFLNTAGDFFFKYKHLISNNIDNLGLPIDFSESSYRNKNNLKTIIKILSFYRDQGKRPKIKIATVVTKDNFDRLNEIGNLIKNYPVDIWKIYEFIPQSINAIKNKRLLEIPSKNFSGLTKKKKKQFSKYFKVIISRRKDRNRAYFFIGSDGEVTVPVDDFDICREIKVGNIFEKDVIEKWRKLVSENNYINNIEITFGHKFNA